MEVATPIGRKRELLKYRADRLNFWRALTGPLILLLPAFTGLPEGWPALPYGVAVWFALCDLNYVLHQHVHLPMSHSRTVNRLLDFSLSCVTGMSAYNWRQHHIIRHHACDDGWRQTTEREFKNYSFLGSITYSLKAALVMFAFPLWEAMVKGLFKNQKQPINFRAAFFEQLTVSAIMFGLIFHLPAFYGPYFFMVYFFTGMADYDNHVGCGETAYGFANNTTHRCYNWVRNNFGYHTAHHCYPEAHWTRLPELHAKIAGNIPPARIGRSRWVGLYSPPILFYLFVKKEDGVSVEIA